MSGGSYDYAFRKVDAFIEDVTVAGDRETTKLRFAFIKHLEKVSAAMKAIEWVDSGDKCAGDEAEFIKACLSAEEGE